MVNDVTQRMKHFEIRRSKILCAVSVPAATGHCGSGEICAGLQLRSGNNFMFRIRLIMYIYTLSLFIFSCMITIGSS